MPKNKHKWGSKSIIKQTWHKKNHFCFRGFRQFSWTFGLIYIWKSSVLLQFCRSGPTVFGKSGVWYLQTLTCIYFYHKKGLVQPTNCSWVRFWETNIYLNRYIGPNKLILHCMYDVIHLYIYNDYLSLTRSGFTIIVNNFYKPRVIWNINGKSNRM